MGRWNLTKTWWGDAWSDAIDTAFWDHVLSASRKIVKNDGVKKLIIKDSSVSAKVKGTHKNYYDTIIGFDEFSDENIKTIMKTIKNDPLILSALLNHELPEDLYFQLMENGIEVFPFSFSNLSTYCDCNEWVDFCKHKAALLYQLAIEIDKDPFLIFKLQGCDLLKLLNCDHVHVMANGKIVESGDINLALKIENDGYKEFSKANKVSDDEHGE